MKREFVKQNVSLPIVMLKESQQYSDRYFAFTKTKGTTVHPYLIQNDGKGTMAGKGIFIMNKTYLQAQAKQLGISVQSYVNRVNSDSSNVIEFDVERRVVGEIQHNDDGTVATDRDGNEIHYNGDSRTKDEGAEYFLVQNTNIVLSAAVKDRLLELDDKADVAYRLEKAKEDERPKLLAPARTRKGVISGDPDPNKNDGGEFTFREFRSAGHTKESKASYEEAKELAHNEWIAQHEPV